MPAAPSAAIMPAAPLGQVLPAGPAPGLAAPGLSPGFAANPGQLAIEFGDIPGLEIRISFREASGKILITTEPSYRDDGKEGGVTPARLSAVEEEARRQLALAQRELDVADRKLKSSSDRLKKLNADEPLSSSRRFPAWKREHTEETTNVAFAERSVSELTARVDKLKARLDSVPKLRGLLKDSAQAEIHYVVYSECGETDMLLLDGRKSQ
jgi:hypothetical protein